MESFTKSIIDQNILTKDQLLEAWLLRSDQMMSSLEISCENRLIEDEKIVRILSRLENGESFLSGAKRLQLVEDSQISSIEKLLHEHLKPLTDKEIETSAVSESVDKAVDVETGDRYNFSFESIGSETKKQYIDFFSKDIKLLLEDGFNQISSDGADLENILLNLEETLQQLTAASNFARMEVSYCLAEKLTLFIEGLTSHEIPLDKNKKEFRDVCITALDILWELHRFIDVSGQELEFWQNDVSKSNYCKLMDKLDSFLGGKK